ncbi:MAG: hypothetical protein ACTHMT_10935 [Verrucomicrobiota bacterium]
MEFIIKFLVGLAAMVGTAALAGFVAWYFIKKSENPGSLVVKWIVTFIAFGALIGFVAGMGVAGPPIAAAVGVVLGIIWAPSLGAIIAKPLTSFYDGGDAMIEDRPFYSISRAKQKQGRYQEAIADVKVQLMKFPQDYEGWMLLAEVHGDSLKDNAAAQECIEELFHHNPPHTMKNLAFSLNRSADWHLSLASDREAARGSLQRILDLFPDSEFAHHAAQRIAHLTSDAMLAEKKERPRIALTRHEENIGLAGESARPVEKVEEPPEKAVRLVGHLNEHPFDATAREELAMIYIEHYGRLELAEDQIEQMISAPGMPQKSIARYLNLLADWHVRYTQNQQRAGDYLRRILELFPNSADARKAEKRISMLCTEMRGKTKSQVLQLGSYEENIGLKGQKPGE